MVVATLHFFHEQQVSVFVIHCKVDLCILRIVELAAFQRRCQLTEVDNSLEQAIGNDNATRIFTGNS